MRFLVLVIVATAAAKMVGLYDPALGTNIAFWFLFFFLVVLHPLKIFRISSFRSKVLEGHEARERSISQVEVKLFPGRILWPRISDVQLVFIAETAEGKVLFVCGSWWLGCLIDRIRVYSDKMG